MSDKYRQVSSRIECDWYPFHEDEEFSQDDICRHFQWNEPDTRHAVSQKLHNDKKKDPPILEKRGKAYRIIDRECEEIDWQSADGNSVVDIILPFNLQKYVKFFPKSIIIVAGSSNAGKTAWLYNFILMNMHKHIITLYNSETGREQMKERFSLFEQEIPNPAPFRTIERYDNFADIIKPNEISVIDYVDSDSDYYNSVIEISRIYRALKGVAVIGLQKKSNVKDKWGKVTEYDVGYGGEPTLKRASLYIAMNQGKLKIVKGKSWADRQINPNGMKFTYKLIDGCKFVNIERDYENE